MGCSNSSSNNSGITEEIGSIQTFDGHHFVIEFINVSDVPKADLLSESDPFIQAYVAIKTGENKFEAISRTVETPFRHDNKDPIFHSFQDFFVTPSSDAYIMIKFFDYDVSNENDLLGSLEIPISELNSGDSRSFKIRFHEYGNAETHPNFALTLRRVLKTPPKTRTFFIVRHGESKWNQAQAKMNITGMVGQNDHGLTEDGITQAYRLNLSWQLALNVKTNNVADRHQLKVAIKASRRASKVDSNNESFDDMNDVGGPDDIHNKLEQRPCVGLMIKNYAALPFSAEKKREEYISLFSRADRVYSSPLTRAVQTALVAMNKHPAMLSQGLTLYSVIREVKGPGGMDTVGTHIGEKIVDHVKSEFAGFVAADLLPTDVIDSFTSSVIHINDADMPWWTPQMMVDSKTDVQGRVDDFLSFVRYCDAETPVFVGHSLFFKAFYSKRISSALEKHRPSLAKLMRTHKLGNASMMAVTVGYVDEPVVEKELMRTKALILDADMMFNTGFHGDHRPDDFFTDVDDIDVEMTA